MNEFIKEQELDNIMLKLLVSRRNFEEKLLELIMKQLENESSMFLFSFKRELEQHNQFKELEELYGFSEEIKGIYSKCIEIFNKNVSRFHSSEVKEILNGIIWGLKNVLEDYPREFENKIELERIEMVSDAIQHMKNIFKNAIQDYMNHIPTRFIDFEISKILEKLLIYVFENEGSSIQEVHGNALKMLNVIDRRVEGKAYINFVAFARKNLETYRSINVDTIMSYIDEDADVEVIKNIIAVIHELYNKLDLKEKELYAVVNGSKFSTKTIQQSFEKLKDYSHMIERVMKNEELIELIKLFEENKRRIFESLSIEIIDELKKTVTFTLDEINDESMEVQYLSCQVVHALKQVLEQLKEDKLKEFEEEKDIFELIKVLVETLKLKYETLKEKDLAHILSKKEQFVEYEKKLIDFSTEFKSKLASNFEKMMTESKESFISSKETLNRLVNQLKEHNLKTDLSYLKTDLLFELVTLEEIIKFCVPKLKLYERENVQEIVRIMDECYQLIYNTIQHSGIEIIEPNIHDKFNGKDQEIILVESVVGFKKGEIVAVHTKGYKYKGVPVVRANVIAAK